MVLRRFIRYWLTYALALPLAAQYANRTNVLNVIPDTTDTAVGAIRLFERRMNGTSGIDLRAPDSLAGNFAITFPNADGSSGTCLGWVSANTLGWVACSSASALADPGGNGIVVRTALGVTTARTIQVTAPLGITNGSGVSGDPSLTCTECFRKDAANTVSTGAQDFGAATSFKVPASAGAGPTASGLIAYDSTSNTLEAGVNGANKIVAFTDGNVATSTALAANPAACSGGQFVTDIDADGTLTCGTPAGGGNVSGPGSTTNNNYPQWDSTLRLLKDGKAGASTNTPNTLVERDGSGNFAAGTISATLSGNASTATALAADPVACPGGQFASDIAANGTLTCGAPSGSFVSGPGASTDNYFPQWNGTSGLLLKAGLGRQTTTPLANAVMTTDSAGAYVGYDKGSATYHAHAFTCNADGVTNDFTCLQNAINACQDGNGGPIKLLGKTYALAAALTFGNGSSAGLSTKKPCWFEGSGSGDTVSTTNGTEIKWTGGNQGATTYMITLAGPGVQFNMFNLVINPNSATNVLAVKAQQIAFSRWDHVTIYNQATGPAVTFKPVRNPGVGGVPNGCSNVITNLVINAPATSGEGVLFDETASVTADSCSNTFDGGNWHGTNYGVKLIFADNNHFRRMQFSGTTSILFQQSAINAAFPHENTFVSVSPTGGVSGTTGTGYPNVFYDYKKGDCSTNCDLSTAISSGTPLSWYDTRGFQTHVISVEGAQSMGWRGDGVDITPTCDVYNAAAATSRCALSGRRARGSYASPGAVTNGDRLFFISAAGYSNSAFQFAGGINFVVDGTVSLGTVPLAIELQGRDSDGNSYTNAVARAEGYFAARTFAAATSNTVCYDTTTTSGMNTLATCSSLAKFKANPAPMINGLEIASRLTPKTYHSLTSGREEIGLIAEEVERVYSRLSTYDRDGELVGVEYGHVAAVAIAAIQELKQRLEALERKMQ